MGKIIGLKKLSAAIGKAQEQLATGKLEIFKLMYTVYDTKAWTMKRFYDASKFDSVAAKWRKAKFTFILKELTGWTIIRFENIERILRLPNGEVMYKKYGHRNMVTYSRHTKDERQKLLIAVEAHIEKNKAIPEFNKKSSEVFPKKQSVLKSMEAERLKKENKQLNGQINTLKGEIEGLKKENVVLRDAIKVLSVSSEGAKIAK